MSWSALPPEHRELATRILTRRQLDALKLHHAGWGYESMGRVMECSTSTAREHLVRAKEKMRKAIEESEAA